MKNISPLHNRVVVAHMDGTVSIEEIKNPDNVFNEAKEIIGCDCLDYFLFREFDRGASLAILVDDNGYGRYGLDKTKVNKIATYLYGTGHFILGDAVIVWDLPGDEGHYFAPFKIPFAEMISNITAGPIKSFAEEQVILPEGNLPVPEVKVESYSTWDELEKAWFGNAEKKKD